MTGTSSHGRQLVRVKVCPVQRLPSSSVSVVNAYLVIFFTLIYTTLLRAMTVTSKQALGTEPSWGQNNGEHFMKT